MSSKKTLQNCSECGNAHVPKGGRPCSYVEMVKKKSQVLGNIQDWKLHIDLDLMTDDSDAYVGKVRQEDTQLDAELVRSLVAKSRECMRS